MRQFCAFGGVIAVAVALGGACAPSAGLMHTEPATTHGETWIHEDARVSMWIPDSWSIERDGEVVMIADPLEEVALVLYTLRARELDRAMEALDHELETFVRDIRVTGDAEETSINGMRAVIVDATGRVDGVAVDLSIALIRAPSRRILVVLGIAESDKLLYHERTLARIVTSLQPIGGELTEVRR
jgi:predicted Zn-dependent protease